MESKSIFITLNIFITIFYLISQENGRSYLRHEQLGRQQVRESEVNPAGGGGALSQFLFESGSLLNDLAASQVTYEIGEIIDHRCTQGERWWNM